MKASEPILRLPYRRGSVEYCLGSEADHEAVYQLLLHIFHAPDRESFLGALNDPWYRPDRRILVKVDGRIVSHLHMTERKIRYGSVHLPMNGVMWVGTLPEYRGLGFAQNLLKLADMRGKATGCVIQTLTTSMPQFYRASGWVECGGLSVGVALSRNLPPMGDGLVEGKGAGAIWHVRPWRQVELGDLMKIYDQRFGRTTGSVVRDEEYWRWVIGRRYAHVIWVACHGDRVRGYAFVKDHRILEIAADEAHPRALQALLGRVRSEAMERAYPEVVVHAPLNHPVMDVFEKASGRVVEQEDWDGTTSMYHICDVEGFLKAILPELGRRARDAGADFPVEMGLTVDDRRWLIHVDADPSKSRIEPDKLSRRHLTLSGSSMVRLALGRVDFDQGLEHESIEASTATAIDAARILFPRDSVWRGALDGATA